MRFKHFNYFSENLNGSSIPNMELLHLEEEYTFTPRMVDGESVTEEDYYEIEEDEEEENSGNSLLNPTDIVAIVPGKYFQYK